MKERGATAAEIRTSKTHIAVTRLDPTVYITMRFTIESDLLIPERAFRSSHIKTMARSVSANTATTPTASCKGIVLSVCVISLISTKPPKHAMVNANWARTPMLKTPASIRFLPLTCKESALARITIVLCYVQYQTRRMNRACAMASMKAVRAEMPNAGLPKAPLAQKVFPWAGRRIFPGAEAKLD